MRKVYLKLPKPTFEDQRSGLTQLTDGLGGGLYLDHRLLPRLSSMARGRGGLTAAIDGSRVMALEAGDTRGSCYGLAVDIGTTTAVAMLWDLNRGACLGTAARTNPQGLYGADVISRIQYCNEGKGHLDRLQRLIIGCVNDMAAELAEEAGISLESIYAVTAVGNTAMSHLFLGVHPGPLARSPFAPVFAEGQDRLAQELGLNVNPLANLHFLPNIAGHVGAGITAALLFAGIGDMKGTYLAIDIGTNGEIALSRNGRILACSTAAGPAKGKKLISTVEEYDKIGVLDPTQTPRMSKYIYLVKRLVEERGNEKPIVAFVFGPLGILSMQRGLSELMMDMFTDKEPIFRAMENITQTLIRFCDALMDAGAHAIMLDTLYASKTIMSPQMWEEFEGDYVERLAKHIHGRGCMVMIHNCGEGVYFKNQIDRMHPEAISFLYLPHDCATPAGMKEKYGGVTTLIGHIDPGFLMTCTEEELRALCRRQIDDYKKDGGFILATGCEYPAPMDDAFARVIIDEALTYGRY